MKEYRVTITEEEQKIIRDNDLGELLFTLTNTGRDCLIDNRLKAMKKIEDLAPLLTKLWENVS